MSETEGKPRGSESFARRYRLGGNKYYRIVYRKGKSCPSRNLVLIYLKGKDVRLGFSVSSKVGNAVTRNRIRRCLREDARRLRAQMIGGRYIFVARPAAKNVPHAQLTKEMLALLTRNRLFREGEEE